MSKEIKLIIRPDGVAEQYDDTYDLTIHCTSEDEQKEVLKIMNQAAKLRQLKPHGDLIDRDALLDMVRDVNTDYFCEVLGVTVEDIDSAPAVIEAEGSENA